jgi:hypothetical protein
MVDIKDPLVPIDEAGLEEAFKSFDPANAVEDAPDPVTPVEETPQAPVETPVAETKEEVVEEKKEEAPAAAPKIEAPKDEEIDYKQRFVDTQKEGKLLYDQNQDIMTALTAEVPEPTELELKQEATRKGLEFEMMTATEQILFKDSIYNQKKVAVIDRVRELKTKRETWSSEIDTFLADESVATRLKGREDAFKVYATKPTKIGYPSKEDLLTLFLAEELPKTLEKKGSSLPFTVGTGGAAAEKPKKLGVEASMKLKTQDQKKWQDMIAAGAIDTTQDL